MKIKILAIGKLKEKYLLDGIEFYKKRISYYLPISIIEIPDIKNYSSLSIEEIKNKEAEKIKDFIRNSDYIIVLDEKGKEYSSIEFSKYLQSLMNIGTRELLFIIGGSFGLSEKILEISDEVLSLSKMTFPHDLVRLIFIEQLYRALTIIKNEKYHH